MDAREALAALGGVAGHGALVRRVTRGDLARAVAAGTVLRLAHGRYALASVDDALQTAHGLSGTLCLTSAALQHGWAVKTVPEMPHVAVARGRRLTPEQAARAEIHRLRLGPDDVAGAVTSKEATLLHCLRCLPEDEALAVADSALRAGEEAALSRVARTAQGGRA